jgi:hypothetical protein
MLSPRQCIFSYTIKVNLVRDIYTFGQSPGKFTLHPLIHTLLEFNLAQDMVACQRLPLYVILVLPSDKQGESEVKR